MSFFGLTHDLMVEGSILYWGKLSVQCFFLISAACEISYQWLEKVGKHKHRCTECAVLWPHGINSLPNNKILDWSKLKAFVDDKINATQILKFVLRRVENIVGKGEIAGYQHFLLFPQYFLKLSFSGSLKVGIVW